VCALLSSTQNKNTQRKRLKRSTSSREFLAFTWSHYRGRENSPNQNAFCDSSDNVQKGEWAAVDGDGDGLHILVICAAHDLWKAGGRKENVILYLPRLCLCLVLLLAVALCPHTHTTQQQHRHTHKAQGTRQEDRRQGIGQIFQQTLTKINCRTGV
jgi:hypothetical protein